MKRKEKEELRKKSKDQLLVELNGKRKDLLKAKMEKGQGKLKDVKKVARIRGQIATMATFIREKEMEEQEK